jgi:hypothetical protein
VEQNFDPYEKIAQEAMEALGIGMDDLGDIREILYIPIHHHNAICL